MWRALTTHFIAPPKLEPLSSIPSDTATGIFLLLHAVSPVAGRWAAEGAKTIILALLRSRHACCAAADEPPPLRSLGPELLALALGRGPRLPQVPSYLKGIDPKDTRVLFSEPLHVLGERQARARADEGGLEGRR